MCMSVCVLGGVFTEARSVHSFRSLKAAVSGGCELPNRMLGTELRSFGRADAL